jgi:hypothetical protein
MEEDVYMKCPDGQEAPLDENGDPMVVRLIRSLYGLKQSNRNWCKLITSYLLEFGMTQLQTDIGVYYLRSDDIGLWVMICLFVDDFFIGSTSNEWVDTLVAFLSSRLQIKDLGDLTLALGMEISRDRENKVLKISQRKYLEACLKRFDLENLHSVTTPGYIGDLHDNNGALLDTPLDVQDTKLYQQMVGCLLYASICTRFDILLSISRCARSMVAPTRDSQLRVKRIFQYIIGTLDYGITYKASDMSNVLTCYSDSDFGGSELSQFTSDSKIKHRSTTGYCVLLNGAPIKCYSKLQDVVAYSTAEAEYYAAGLAVQGTLATMNLMEELGMKQSNVTILCDNQASIKIAHQDQCSSKTKHISMKYHQIRCYIKTGDVRMEYVQSKDNIADGLTKALDTISHQDFVNGLLGSAQSDRLVSHSDQ